MNDEVRTEQLEAFNFTVLRFSNDEVRYQIGEVLAKIENNVEQLKEDCLD